LAHILVGEPASTSPEYALVLAHILVGEPASIPDQVRGRLSPEYAPAIRS